MKEFIVGLPSIVIIIITMIIISIIMGVFEEKWPDEGIHYRTPQATKISSTLDELVRLCFDEEGALKKKAKYNFELQNIVWGHKNIIRS